MSTSCYMKSNNNSFFKLVYLRRDCTAILSGCDETALDFCYYQICSLVLMKKKNGYIKAVTKMPWNYIASIVRMFKSVKIQVNTKKYDFVDTKSKC